MVHPLLKKRFDDVCKHVFGLAIFPTGRFVKVTRELCYYVRNTFDYCCLENPILNEYHIPWYQADKLGLTKCLDVTNKEMALGRLLEELKKFYEKSKTMRKVRICITISEDLAKVIQAIDKKLGGGYKSKIIDAIVRKTLHEHGLAP